MLHEEDMYDFTSEYKEYLSSIVLEIIGTEQHVIEYSEEKKGKIRDFGGMIALDNFGSGYNNDALLVISSPNIIKIDKSIIDKIDEDLGKQQLLKIFISYAQSRNIKIIAEGVENQKEMETVVSFGVDYLQGYYIGQPAMDIVPIEENVVREIKEAREMHSMKQPG
jgi:EAL domain-containing protein (putative c-di-GMP-specific phosphodiesterase class I)